MNQNTLEFTSEKTANQSRQRFVSPMRRNRRARRRGSVLVYVGLGLIAFIGVASLSVDMGSLYGRKARAQTAADAAALAGAYELANFRDSNASTAALNLSKLNGYEDKVAGATVATTYPVNGNSSRFKVQVSRTEPLFFARIFGLSSRPVTSTATAQFETQAELSIGSGDYGQPGGSTNLSVFGPDGLYSYGDFRSTKYLDNGQPNPDYDGKGYNFTIKVPSNYNDTVVEIYDPDCYNNGGRFVKAGVRIDELRKPWDQNQNDAVAASDITTTRYRLYWDKNGRGNPADLVLIGEQSYGNDASTDMQWAQAFNFNRSSYPGGNFLMNVTSTSGSSENAFNLRAGPAGVPFDPQNGTSITADGSVPMNFNNADSSGITLGNIPETAKGKQLTIRKFDTDVGSKSVSYTYTMPDGTVSAPIPGVLAGNGQFATDTITLPDDYAGGLWKATYTAGANDTSVWSMSFEGEEGKPGPIRLVE